MPLAYWWLIAGAVFLIVEAFGATGIGFLFAGLAAIIVGALVHWQVIAADALILQFGIFFGITALIAALLWRKLKYWRTDPSNTDQFINILGDTAKVVDADLQRGHTGRVRWSGTTMSATLAADCKIESVRVGDTVVIKEVHGNELVVAPMQASE